VPFKSHNGHIGQDYAEFDLCPIRIFAEICISVNNADTVHGCRPTVISTLLRDVN